MAHYRIYLLTHGLPHGPPLDADYPDDVTALSAIGAQLKPGNAAEIWQGARFVARLGSAEAKPWITGLSRSGAE